MRLPSSVTPQTIADQLRWVASIKREISKQAHDTGEAGWNADQPDAAFYDKVADLLARPEGGRQLLSLVLAVDPSKTRNLSKALLKKAAECLGRHRSSYGDAPELVTALLARGEPELAGWIVFDILSQARPGLVGDALVQSVVDLSKASPELRAWLGEYLTDWTGSADGSGSGDDRWSVILDKVRTTLDQAEPFNAGVAHVLREAAEELDGLTAAKLESQQRAARDAEERDACLHRLQQAAASLPGRQNWAASFLDAARPDALGALETGLIAEAASWAEHMSGMLAEANTRFEAAKKAANDDDEDDALHQEYDRARTERQRRNILAAEEAQRWIGRLRQTRSDHVTVGAAHDAPEGLASEAGTETADLTTESGPPGDAAPDGGYAPANPYDLPAAGIAHDPAPRAADEPIATRMEVELSEPDGPAIVVDPVIPKAESLVQWALQDGRYGLAAHLARAAEALGATGVAGAGSAVLTALCLGEALDEVRRGPVEVQYGRLLPEVLDTLEAAVRHQKPLALLALAGALRPALFSPHSGAAEVVRKADPLRLGPHLNALAGFVVGLPKRGGTLDMAAAGPANDVQAIKVAVDRACRRILDTADRAPAKKAPYARATQIWQALFKEGRIHDAVAALRSGRPDTRKVLAEAAVYLDRGAATCVEELDQKARRRNDAALVGKARDWLVSSVTELARDLATWLAAERRATATTPSNQVQLHHELRDLVTAAVREVDGLRSEPGLAVPAAVCRRALDGVLALLAGQPSPVPGAGLGLDMLLDDDLLLLDPFPRWTPGQPWTAAAATTAILAAESMAAAPPGFQAAFERLLSRRMFASAELADAHLAAAGDADPSRASRIAAARLQALGKLRDEVDRLREEADDLLGADTDVTVDPAVAGQLDAWQAQLNGGQEDDDAISQRVDFPNAQADLDQIAARLQQGAARLLAPLEERIEQLERQGHQVGTLRELAAKRDLVSLRESLDGWSGPAGPRDGDGRRSVLKAFGEAFACRAFAALPVGQRSVGQALADLDAGRRTDHWDFAVLGEADREQARKLLRAWQALLAPGSGDIAVRDVLLEVGLAGARIEKQAKLARARSYRVSLDPTTDRRDCPVPAFGSDAKGKLNVLVAEAQGLNVNELHRQMRELDGGSVVPVLVVIKGLLLPEQRVRFMKEVRRTAIGTSSALLDEAGILFLATRPGRSRRDMFAVALPAGAVQPYSNASNRSAPEMFFGRADEIAHIWDQNGSCLVYGGRQLGKTALLQQVRVRYHNPTSQVVVYGSLQGETELWPHVAHLLKDATIPCGRATRIGVEEAVKAWLDTDLTRRVLVLVDEADHFLSNEIENGYKQLTVVRDLMRERERRCKFVFAGLHDVQRLARTPNSPLHHFGSPLCIGPLLGKDLEDARRMVTMPMEAAGVRFDGLSLPTRILSAVNYYPSLLQTFGATLLRQVNQSIDTRLGVDVPLPIIVGDGDVKAALDDNSFKEDIRDKFRMTLDLDERYKLITLAILHRTIEMRDQGPPAGPLSDVDIQQLAQSWWPQGFAESATLGAFQGLLQEMIGLGVLRQSGDGYVVRSSRIAAMLGGKDQIDKELLELSARPAPSTDTGSLRRLEENGMEPAPLTLRQEGSLLDWANRPPSAPPVSLVLSSKALGVDNVPTSLESLPTDGAVKVSVARYATARELRAVLDAAGQAATRARRHLAVASGPWLGRDMVEAALAATQVARNARHLRVLLVPQSVDWDEADAEHNGQLWGAEVLTLSPMGPTGLRQWLTATTGTAEAGAVSALHGVTGGFPALLRRLPKTAGRQQGGRLDGTELNPPVRLEELGLDDARLQGAARAIVECNIRGDHAQELEAIDVLNASKVVEHLERLGVLERTSPAGPELDLNPLVRRVLAS